MPTWLAVAVNCAFSRPGQCDRKNRTTSHAIRAERPFDSAQLHHVAAIYDGSTIDLFVNGVRQTNGRRSDSNDNEVTTEQQQNISLRDLHEKIGLYIGAANPLTNDPNGRDHFTGIIDELRISNIARYNKDYTPAKRFEPDKHTLALYHFDEGEGDQLKDASGNNHHGKISGAKWVRIDGDLRVIETPAANEPATNEPNVDSPVSAPVP